jgi:hypothetical protein
MVLLHNPEFLLTAGKQPAGTERSVLLDERRRYVNRLFG